MSNVISNMILNELCADHELLVFSWFQKAGGKDQFSPLDLWACRVPENIYLLTISAFDCVNHSQLKIMKWNTGPLTCLKAACRVWKQQWAGHGQAGHRKHCESKGWILLWRKE